MVLVLVDDRTRAGIAFDKAFPQQWRVTSDDRLLFALFLTGTRFLLFFNGVKGIVRSCKSRVVLVVEFQLAYAGLFTLLTPQLITLGTDDLVGAGIAVRNLCRLFNLLRVHAEVFDPSPVGFVLVRALRL